ncbi:pyridoxal kinase PdxY [Nakamurella aerolata]|uniref:pyridoxal kinase n=1 Tax=Nakamurella aerolata TaxID=1656892 RepID=A0A849A874_9ACTN|nr:pyridoxal kinase PdxY [Nakamurella aerolata]NNG36759.1 pyridoxal kinase PdxY [Nakamurella aerolata]
MRILSIQSSVAYGHVGNSAAAFPLQRLGHEVWPVLTVHFSNHTGYGQWQGPVLDPADVRAVLAGIEDLGVLGTADAVLTGYQGSPGVAAIVLDTVAKVRQLNPRAVYCCDPVLGDIGTGFFVLPGLPALMRDEVLPQADMVTPNVFELAYLASDAVAPEGGQPPLDQFADVSSLEAVQAAVERVRARGPRTVLVTSVEHSNIDGIAPDHIGMLGVDDTGSYLVTTPRLDADVNGLGDVTAALLLAHLSAGLPAAMEKVAGSVFAILKATVDAGSREIQLITAQDEIAQPTMHFRVERL